MKLKLMVTLAVGMTVTTLISTSLQAQPPGERRGPRNGMGRMRNSPKARLEGLLRGVGRFERAGKTPLNKAQARKMVALMVPWKKKSRMSDAEAEALSLKLRNVLTVAQKTALQSSSGRNPRDGGGPNGRRGGGRRRGDGGPDGGRRGPGGGRRGDGRRRGGGFGDGGPSPEQLKQMQQRMQAMQAFVKIYNPFYPPTSYAQVKAAPERMREGMTRRYQTTMALLTQLSKKAK